MENKKLSDYLFNPINNISGILGIVVFLFGLSINNIWITISCSLFLFLIIFIYSLFKLYKDLKLSIESTKINETALLDEKNKFVELERKFNIQSEKYENNINELNLHKQVTHIVTVLIDSQSPSTGEGKKLIKMLETSVKQTIERSDNNEL